MSAVNFGKAQRVRQGWEYKRIYRKGRRFHLPTLTLVVFDRARIQGKRREVSQSEISRLGLSVSRKVDKHAVGRNLLKRRLRELFRNGRQGLKPGMDLVLVPKAGASRMSFADLESAFTTLCRKAGIQR